MSEIQPKTRTQRAIELTAERLPAHVTAERREAVVTSAWVWWMGAAAATLVAFAMIAVVLYLVAKGVAISLTLAVLLGCFVAVPVVAALFCANMASRSATAATLQAIGGLYRTIRGHGRAADSNGV